MHHIVVFSNSKICESGGLGPFATLDIDVKLQLHMRAVIFDERSLLAYVSHPSVQLPKELGLSRFTPWRLASPIHVQLTPVNVSPRVRHRANGLGHRFVRLPSRPGSRPSIQILWICRPGKDCTNFPQICGSDATTAGTHKIAFGERRNEYLAAILFLPSSATLVTLSHVNANHSIHETKLGDFYRHGAVFKPISKDTATLVCLCILSCQVDKSRADRTLIGAVKHSDHRLHRSRTGRFVIPMVIVIPLSLGITSSGTWPIHSI
mmetsp:Transcript_53099/g.116514  ORF Transcript_53099/g.116514 Transcript_53099/m.116514 type:complete len:264 (-) Transcript_53099:3255-4046(-)